MEVIQMHYQEYRSEEFAENSSSALHSMWSVSTAKMPWPN